MDPSRARRSSAASTLRTAAVWATVSEAAAGQSAALGRPLRVLDLGGGTGGLAVPLAEHGHDVTVVDGGQALSGGVAAPTSKFFDCTHCRYKWQRQRVAQPCFHIATGGL